MYKDLSLKEKSELFKLMVSNGITDINEIEKIYNRYDDGGNKISVNNLPESEQYAVTTPDGQRKVFNNKVEAQQYITTNTPKGYSLYDTTNYGSNIDKGQTAILDRNTEREIEKATKQEELAKARLATRQQNKEIGKEMLSYMPVIGDGMDLYQLGKDAYNGNYLNAGIGLGLMALPNVIEKPLKYVGKGIKKLFNKNIKNQNNNINYLNWDNWSKGGETSKDHLEEYKKIEKEAKSNGTWLKNEDGSKFIGDPHSWVQMQSESFKKNFNPIIWYTGTGKGREIDPTYLGEQWLSSSAHRARTYAYNDDFVEELVIPKNVKITSYDAKNRNWRGLDRGIDGNRITTNDIRDKYLKNKEALLIQRVKDYGPHIITNKSKYYNKTEDEAFLKSIYEDDFYDTYTEPDDLVIGKNTPRKSILFNNGDFDIENPNKYISLLPIIGATTGLSLINNTEDNQYKYGGAINKFSGVSNEVKQKKEIIYPDIVYKHRELWNKEMERRKSRMKDARKKQQKRKSYAEEAHRIMDVLNSSAEKDLQLKNNLQEGIEGAINEQQEQQRENYYNNQLFLNSLATAAELGSAAWMLGKGAKALGILPNRLASSGLYSSDTPQIVSGIAGTLADSYQLATTTTPKDIIENSVELPFDVAGIIGGTNVVRNTPFFGRYRNVIDNILDGAGYIAAGYDGIIKPIDWTLSQFNNAATPEEFPIVLPEITVVGNKKSRGGLINKYDGTSTKTQQMQTMEKPAFFEGDTWKPQYWFSPEYEANTLKGAITQAYEDGNYGKDIIWNGRAYKAILNEEDSKEYRKEKGITLREPIVNTANIKTNEKQPREYVSNSYIPITSGNKTYYWDSYSGKFFKDAKGKVPTSEDYNTLLKDYYDQNISPALKENRYEDLIKLYVQQFRNLQARRRVSAREQDIPNDYGKRTIPITTGRSGSSRLPYPTDLIDSLSNHLQEGQSIYQALALPYKETEFGNRVNFESDVMGNRGHVLATLNDERYELPDQTFYSGLSYPLRAYFRNNKVNGKVDGMTQENFVKHYLASSENDLLDLKNLFNNKELLKYVGETLKKDLTKSRFVSFMNTNTKDNPNIYEHALSLLASGKYNPGEPGYNKGINKIAKQLENDPELNNYIDKHKIKKVGEKKK